jgi:hypothetical protein
MYETDVKQLLLWGSQREYSNLVQTYLDAKIERLIFQPLAKWHVLLLGCIETNFGTPSSTAYKIYVN